jgi:hypothetical protein
VKSNNYVQGYTCMVDQSSKKDTKVELLLVSELLVNTRAYGWLLAVEVLTHKISTGKPYLFPKQRDQCVNEITSRYFDPLGTEADRALGEFVEYVGSPRLPDSR